MPLTVEEQVSLSHVDRDRKLAEIDKAFPNRANDPAQNAEYAKRFEKIQEQYYDRLGRARV